jgi:hypothetical protein
VSKVLRIEMPDESVWEADALPVAEARANYYSGVDGVPQGGADWLAEVAYALSDPDELRDWALNNMNWAELNATCVVLPKPPDYAGMWGKARLKVVDR